MKEVNSISMIKDKQLANEIIDLLLARATQVDYVLELVTASFITIDEQLANKLHVALARTTTKLLQQKQDVIDFSKDVIPFAYARDKLDELSSVDRLGYLLDICKGVFPNGVLESSSTLSADIFNDTITCIKQVIRKKNLTTESGLISIYNYNYDRVNYLKLLIKNNNIFKD